MSNIIDINEHLEIKKTLDEWSNVSIDFDFEEDFDFGEDWKKNVICEGNTEYWSITRNPKK